MNIPIFWLKDYVKLPKSLAGLTDKLTLAGHMLDKITKVDGETVVDLELRGNRADCYSILGIAREVSALFPTPVTSPKVYKNLRKVPQLAECKNNIKTTYVKRVMMVAIKDIKICESPDWLKKRLNAYGMPTINNIVDLTNFVMLETGEPMHAFDLDKLGHEIEIRLAREGEKVVTFLDQTLTLTKDDLVWANSDSVLSVAGAIGGKNRSILPDTKNILLEAASYDRANIRRTIYRHNLLTDAGIRHEKDLDPNLVETGIYRFLQIIDENGWGKIEPYVFDYYPKLVKSWTVNFSLDQLEKLSGLVIPPAKVEEILTRLNCKITTKNTQVWKVVVPTYRTDVTLPEDLIEEVLRIYGYDQIPVKTLDLEIPAVATPDFINQEINLKNIVAGFGFNEVITLSFVKEKFLNLNCSFGQQHNQFVKVVNAPSPDTKALRLLLLPNLYETAKRAIDERAENLAFFEVGKVFAKIKNNYSEKRKLGLIFWNKDCLQTNLIFKGYLEAMLGKLNIADISYKETLEVANLTESYELYAGTKIVGYAGKYQGLNFAEIDLDLILDKTTKPSISLWPKFPPQIEDITLTFPAKTYIGSVVNLFSQEKTVAKVNLTTVYENNYTFRVWYQNPTKTLTDLEVATIREKLLKEIKQKFGGVLKNP